MEYPPRIWLAHLPTPIEPLPRLSAELVGPEIWLKRDDQTGLATGGNKTRKLEYILADALEQGCNHLVTLGAVQSNHCRQTAAAAAKLGLGCSLVLSGFPQPVALGNLQLDQLFHAEITWAGNQGREEIALRVMETIRERGLRPYLIPLGCSNALGTIGYVSAFEETYKQITADLLDFDMFVLASSSGGAQAGLLLGAALNNFKPRILGVSIDAPKEDLSELVKGLVTAAAQLIGAGVEIEDSVIDVNDDYVGKGYAIVGDLERKAIRLVARLEGLLLDPVYTGRAMGGLIDLIQKGKLKNYRRIIFWHTGGTAALSAFSNEI